MEEGKARNEHIYQTPLAEANIVRVGKYLSQFHGRTDGPKQPGSTPQLFSHCS